MNRLQIAVVVAAVRVLVGVAQPHEEQARARRLQVLQRDLRGERVGAVVGLTRIGLRRAPRSRRGGIAESARSTSPRARACVQRS